jgi:GTPase SAR1 family protein
MENIYLPIHQKIIEKLDFFHRSNKIPNIIFHGSSGSGKRTIVEQFLNKIYSGDKHKLKTNVMIVNCAHGKGIKFIREELKFFAKTNIQSYNGTIFKTIVLINADFLTIDAQSALRRCIELFSYNTRFFIIVENKNKLLNPILSRFCEIYIPEYVLDGKFVNLHQYSIQKTFTDKLTYEQETLLQNRMNQLVNMAFTPSIKEQKTNIDKCSSEVCLQKKSAKHNLFEDKPLKNSIRCTDCSLSFIAKSENLICDEIPRCLNEPEMGEDSNLNRYKNINHKLLVKIATEFYESGLSALDLISWIENTNTISNIHRSTYCICFDNIKSEFRCEKLLILYMLDFIFLRSNKDVKCVLTI